MKIDGGCYCGFIRFEGEADPEKTIICHCTDCQTLSGTAFRTVVQVQSEQFKMLGGEPTSFIKTAESGNRREMTFCPKCGSPLYATAPGPGPKVLNLRAGILRQRDQFVPKVQIWARSKAPWLDNFAFAQAAQREKQ
jgi:hypothetical protein